MSFFSLSALRALLTTESDYDSPNSEEWAEQVRENLEALLILLAGTNVTGSATQDPPNDTTGILSDSAASWAADDHNGRTLLITSGLAIGNLYTIDDTTAGSPPTLVCTGDNLYSDGVRSGDTYLILYDVKTNEDGHDHDGVNSKQAQMPLGRQLICFESEEAGRTVATWGAPSSGPSLDFHIYIPTNPTNVKMGIDLKSASGSWHGYVRFHVVDSGSTEFDSDEEDTTGHGDRTVYELVEMDVDISAAAAGWGRLYVELKNESTAYTYVKRMAAYMNT